MEWNERATQKCFFSLSLSLSCSVSEIKRGESIHLLKRKRFSTEWKKRGTRMSRRFAERVIRASSSSHNVAVIIRAGGRGSSKREHEGSIRSETAAERVVWSPASPEGCHQSVIKLAATAPPLPAPTPTRHSRRRRRRRRLRKTHEQG